jgi:hypothetical protein
LTFERHAFLQETAREEAMPAEVVLAVAFEVGRRFLIDVERVGLLHQLEGLLVTVGVGIGDGCAPPREEPLVDLAAEVVPGLLGIVADGGRPLEVTGRVAIAEADAGVFRSQVGRVAAA